MSAVCLYFQVHQPNRLIPYDFFQIGEHAFYENDQLNADILNKVADRCYLPANQLFQQMIERHGEDFKLCFSLSGVFLEQCEHHRPDVIYSFQQLVKTGNVELLTETYYHSLAYMVSTEEFDQQVQKHQAILERLFGIKPKGFRNTELIYNNELAAHVENLGFQVMLAEGLESVLQGRASSRLHRAPNVKRLVTLLRDRGLSDDLAFRRVDPNWSEYPLEAGHFVDWLVAKRGTSHNLFMDYETLGEHQDASTGVFEFWGSMIDGCIKQGLKFRTPSEVVEEGEVAGVYDCHQWSSWADISCDLSAWQGNVMQREAMEKIHELENEVNKRGDEDLCHVWRKLQTSDHFYYMSTKGGSDGDVHQHFSPYASPYDAYIYYMNALSDLQLRVQRTPVRG